MSKIVRRGSILYIVCRGMFDNLTLVSIVVTCLTWFIHVCTAASNTNKWMHVHVIFYTPPLWLLHFEHFRNAVRGRRNCSSLGSPFTANVNSNWCAQSSDDDKKCITIRLLSFHWWSCVPRCMFHIQWRHSHSLLHCTRRCNCDIRCFRKGNKIAIAQCVHNGSNADRQRYFWRPWLLSLRVAEEHSANGVSVLHVHH